MSGLGPTICGMASRLSPEQNRNAQILLAASRRPIIRKAILEAGLVESGLRNLPGGDRDSSGVLQQRPSQGWGSAGESVATDAGQFVRAAQKVLGGGFRGSAAQLAQAVQRSAFPERYAKVAGQADALRGGGGGSGGGGTTTTTTTGSPGAPDLGAGSTSATDLVSSLLAARQPAAAPVSAPAAPSFSAQAVMPQGYTAPSGGSPQAPPDVSALLAAVRTAGVGPAQDGGQTTTATTSGSGGAQAGSGRYPTGTRGKVIGTPYAGTHTLGNWQSDNAVDIAVPVGTPMVALQGGTVVKVRHHPQDGGRFAGDQITIRGANGNEYFYAHGKASVKPGQRITKGESLGTTGSANGVAHLHFGQMKGDPRMHVR